MATPHNQANRGEIAKTVLMPGDPLRAKWIAETFLTDPHCYNTTRNMLGYTGTYQGIPISVQGSGMGIPSIGIYSYELFTEYEVDRILRVGTAGGIHPSVQLRDIVLGQGACTDSNYAAQYHLPGTFAPIASFALLEQAAAAARAAKIPVHIGNLLSSDVFYAEQNTFPQWQRMGVLAGSCWVVPQCSPYRQAGALPGYHLRPAAYWRCNFCGGTPDNLPQHDSSSIGYSSSCCCILTPKQPPVFKNWGLFARIIPVLFYQLLRFR